MVMTNEEIVQALETGDMGTHASRFSPAPSGRPEFGQVYVIPSVLRDAILAALKSANAETKKVPRVKGKQPE